MSTLRKQALNGIIWTFAQQSGVQVITFVVQVVLARLLMPEMFGLIAMINIFIAIGQLLMDGGMTSSLIRTENPDNLDYSTVFSTNILMSLVIYIFIFLLAPFISSFYEQPILTDLVRVFSLSFVINAFFAVHVAKLTKEMNFKKQMTIQIPSTFIGGLIGIILAYLGYGVWSLVWLNLSQALALGVQYWFFSGWRPEFSVEKSKWKYHFDFGYKMTLSGLLDRVYNNAYNIIIGKFFAPSQVGFFTQAETMRLFPVGQIGTVFEKVTYPLFSNIKSDLELKNVYKLSMKLVLSIVIPMMLILILVAEDFFLLLFGERWLPAVPYFQVLSIASIVRPISNYNLNILKVKGRSDLFLKVELIKKAFGIVALAVSLPFGIMAMVISLTVVSYIFVLINMIASGKLINYNSLEQIKDISLLYVLGVLISVGVYFIYPYFKTNSSFINILIVSVLFLLVYGSALLIFENQLIKKLLSLIKK